MINWFVPKYFGKEKEYVNLALDSGWVSDGQFIKKFEEKFCVAINAPYALTVSNGTTAIYCALLALGIGPGDEVIVPGYGFAAPANMTLAVGATPRFADVDINTWQISLASIERLVNSKTRAIIVIHNYGHVADMPDIISFAKKHKLKVIEDAAEATFSKINNQNVGTFGDIGCFSFQATKLITMGEGGAIVTADSDLLEKATLYRNHGMKPQRRYYHEVIGHNFRLTNLQAALGLAQLEHQEQIISNKKRIEQNYIKWLRDNKIIKFQQAGNLSDSVMWAFACYLNLPEQVCVTVRDTVRKRLLQLGIDTRGGFVCYTDMPIYKTNKLELNNSKKLANGIIILPSSVDLSETQIQHISSKLNKILNEEVQKCGQRLEKV